MAFQGQCKFDFDLNIIFPSSVHFLSMWLNQCISDTVSIVLVNSHKYIIYFPTVVVKHLV